MKTILLKIIITVAAMALLVVHLLKPDLKVDAITLGLLVVALMPWLSHILQEAEFPGGWKVKFRDVQAAGKKITDAAPDEGHQESVAEPPSFDAPIDDPNLALVSLRIEIEKRLRALARKNSIPDRGAVSIVLRQLEDQGVLVDSSTSGLEELIDAGNKAAHGAKVERDAAQWALNYGPSILAALDRTIRS